MTEYAMPVVYAPSRRLFERASAIALIGFIFWPLLTGKPIQSTGHEYLVRAGIHLQYIANLLGILGVFRLFIVVYNGNLFGMCPWLRGCVAALCALLWVELLVALMGASHDDPYTSVGACVYSGLFYGEFVTFYRALREIKLMAYVRRQERENGNGS